MVDKSKKTGNFRYHKKLLLIYGGFKQEFWDYWYNYQIIKIKRIFAKKEFAIKTTKNYH